MSHIILGVFSIVLRDMYLIYIIYVNHIFHMGTPLQKTVLGGSLTFLGDIGVMWCI